MPHSSQPGATPQNRCPKSNAHLDGFQIDFGSILAAQMAPKWRPRGGPDALSDLYQSQIKETKVLASFLLALSRWRRCNLTEKMVVFLKIFTSLLLSHLLVILAHEGLENHFKFGVQDVPKPFQNALRDELHLGSASMTALERFWDAK